MINKGTLYRFAEDTMPPVLWRTFKRTPAYRSIARRVSALTTTPQPENVTVTGGDMAGLTLRINPDGFWQKDMIGGTYDNELFTYLKSLSPEGKTIYDIGAHIGYHSLAFAIQVGPRGRVITFEPNPANTYRLKEILDLNPSVKDRIDLFEVALADTPGEATFLCTDDLEGGSSTGGFVTDATTLWERSVYIEKGGFKEITVPQETIDHLVETKKAAPPDILKIDVEGAEQLVLKGAERTLKTHQPAIIVEFHSIYSTFACLDILHRSNYTTTLLKHEPDGRIMAAAVVNK